MNINEYYSDLDSNRFGKKVAKINDFGVNPDMVLEDLLMSDYDLVLSKIPADNIELINLLEDFGFHVKDAQVTYKYDLNRFDEKLLGYIDDSSVLLRDHQKKDIEEIVKITEESYYGYGHYAADIKLDKKKCLEAYKDWAYRSCTEKVVADKMIVAEVDKQIAGYLSFRIFKENDKKYAAGGLGAVSQKFRGKDIFRKITIQGLKWGLEEGFDWEEHNVLINNYPVNRSFSKLGFVVFKSFYTLHCWL